MPQERDLIERAKRGDRAAISELYRRHADAIYRYVHLRVQDPLLAEDLTAEVFVKMLEGLSDYRYTGAPFVVWLYRIAHARTVDHWRRTSRRPVVTLPETQAARTDGPEAIITARSEQTELVRALADLTDGQQQVILLRFVEEMSLAEVAAVMDKTVGAVKALQHRALAALARSLGEKMASDE